MTALVRRNQNWLPSMFNDLFEMDFTGRSNFSAPAINVKESATSYTVEVAAPGMKKEDFNVRIDEDNNLVVTLERKEKKEEKTEERYLRREFSYSKFQHALILPDDVDKDKISANVEHGILNITLPKLSVEQIKKAQRTIEIK